MTAEEREKNLSCWQILCKEFDAELSGICFLDIETTGFSRLYESIYLIGFTFFEEDCFITQQYLAGSQSEEGILLRRVLDDLRSFKIVATYNGDMFDLPFIKERSARLHIRSKEDSLWFDRMVSLDLMRRYRPYKAFFGWPNMKLKTVEMSLGASRRDPFDGGQLIEVYEEYTKSGDQRLEKTLLLHNYEDIVNLLSLLKVERLMQEIKAGKAVDVTIKGHTLLVKWDRPFSLSVRGKSSLGAKNEPEAEFSFSAGEAFFSVRLPEQTLPLRYYLPHPEDYYYLPRTGEIVHRSLAYDVPASERRKAKPDQCFLSAPEGEYIGCLPLEEGKLKTYKTGAKDQAVFYHYSEFTDWISQTEADEVAEYIGKIVRLIF